MIEQFEGLDKEMLLKKADYLKGTDAEGWAIGDLVEKLVKTNCDLPVVINWVALKDERPPKHNLYYCLGHGGTPMLCYFKHDGWWRQTWSKQVTGITHWRNLPDPPCL